MGRHVIGYEVQKVLAAVDWLSGGTSMLPAQRGLEGRATSRGLEARPTQIGVMGYGEGGLLAFYSAAIDPRIDAVVVSGYFGPRDQLWSEPIDRNVWTLLRDFGDAEILTMIGPRTAIIEASRAPEIRESSSGERTGSSRPSAGTRPTARSADVQTRTVAAPGTIRTPPIEAIREEFERAQRFVNNVDLTGRFELVEAEQGGIAPVASTQTMVEFLHALGIHEPLKSGEAPIHVRGLPDAAARMKAPVRPAQRIHAAPRPKRPGPPPRVLGEGEREFRPTMAGVVAILS